MLFKVTQEFISSLVESSNSVLSSLLFKLSVSEAIWKKKKNEN